jgi:MoaA/NifB/PqqE/SkfB family radical SAM enzyme
MALAETALRAGRLARPLGAYLELTYACNWRCVFCYNPRHHDLRRLNGVEWIAVLDSLRSVGVLQVTLTGGEPLAHPEFFDIAQAARSRAFAIRIFTNGALIDSRETAQAVAGLTPFSVEISLHGATPEVHDATTGREGSFARMWRAIDWLREAGVRLSLKAPVTTINEHEIDAMRELAASRSLPFRFDISITPRDDGDRSPQRYTASPAARAKVIALGIETGDLRQMSRTEGDSNCGIGRASLAIDPEGNVFPCMQWRQTSLGNVRERPLESFWQASEERARLAAMSVTVNDALYHGAADTTALAFCPALAAQRTGDPLIRDEEYSAASATFVAMLRANRRESA